MARQTLTREQIVASAVDLLDAEGLNGFNMRALGVRLESAATAVYWHVGSKSNLLSLAGDHVWGEIALPEVSGPKWREAAVRMAMDLYAMLTRHVWVLEAFGSFVLFGPGKARHDDHSLALFEAAGFSSARADQAAASVFTFVIGNALGPAAAASLSRRLGRAGGNAKKLMRERMSEAKRVALRFPRLRARIGTAGSAYGAAPNDSFERGLEALLEGLEVQLRRSLRA